MRNYAREWMEYPSIARVNEAITGRRRMGSSGTVETYIFGVRKFVQFLGLEDPEAVLEDLKSGKLDPTAQVDRFIDYYLKAHAHKTVLVSLHGIKKWLEVNGVTVEWSKIDMPTSAEKQEEDRAPTKEELKTILNHANGARDRAAILVLSSSGLRIGTLMSLAIGEISFDYPDVARIKVQSKKGRKFSGKAKGTFYSTFITPEAKESLLQYLKERENAGEKLTPSSPLIGDTYHKGKFTSVIGFEQVWKRILQRSGLADKSQKWFKLHVHTLRKYFRSNCIGVDESYRESWMGHKGKYLDESYFRAEEEKHLAEYRKAIPHLTVYTTAVEEKKMRSRMLLDFAKLQGTPESELRKLEEVLARAKTVDEGITEFRRLQEDPKAEPRTMHDGNGKYLVARTEDEMIQRLHDGWRVVQALNHDKYLLEKA